MILLKLKTFWKKKKQKPLLITVHVKLKIKYDRSKPDGMPNKCLDISLAKTYGWKPNPDYIKGFHNTYRDFLNYKSKQCIQNSI